MEFLLICQFEMIIIKLSTIDKIEMANNIKGDSKKIWYKSTQIR
jgi:hypothetical protein